MSPVDVVISHIPPEVVFGTSILPVLVLAIKTFSLSKLPLTSPVLVSMEIPAASDSVRVTSPVLLSIEKLSFAMTRCSDISPVLPLDIRLLQVSSQRLLLPVETFILTSPRALTFDTVTLPVDTESSSSPTDVSSTVMFPVLADIFIFSDTQARTVESPVVVDTSMLTKLKSSGIFKSEVSAFIESALYSLLGRYTLIFGEKKLMSIRLYHFLASV